MSESTKVRILYVCIGNSCRSPMAEAISRARHGRLIEPSSAGIAPAAIIQPLTFQVLDEINIQAERKKPIHLEKADWRSADVIVNMSGAGIIPLIPGFQGATLIWEIPDPIGRPIAVYRESRDKILRHVERLADTLKRRAAHR